MGNKGGKMKVSKKEDEKAEPAKAATSDPKTVDAEATHLTTADASVDLDKDETEPVVRKVKSTFLLNDNW